MYELNIFKPSRLLLKAHIKLQAQPQMIPLPQLHDSLDKRSIRGIKYNVVGTNLNKTQPEVSSLTPGLANGTPYLIRGSFQMLYIIINTFI